MVVSQPYMCVNTHACVLAYTWSHMVTIAMQLQVHMHGGMCITCVQLPRIGVATGLVQQHEECNEHWNVTESNRSHISLDLKQIE